MATIAALSRTLRNKSQRPEQEIVMEFQPWSFHLISIWLFTFSDLKTIVGPKTVFGVLNALAAPVYGVQLRSDMSFYVIPATAFWAWINLLPFVIDNQRSEKSIAEDSLNKPWRPMPSKRLTPEQAKTLMLTLYPVAFTTSLILGGWKQSLGLMLLGYWYNDCGGASGCVRRNFINACGFVCYASGSMEVALGTSLPASRVLVLWFIVILGVVFTTVQTQDFSDQAGDRSCGRETLPLAFGDSASRIITAMAMGIWSLVCPWYWRTPLGPYISFTAIAFVIIFRLLLKRDVKDDKTTFKIWNVWMVFLYSLPLIKYAFGS